MPSDRKVSVTFPHLVCMYMYSKKWRNVYICLTYDLRLKNMYVHFFVSIFFGSFIILWLQKCVIASKITFLLQRSGAFEFYRHKLEGRILEEAILSIVLRCIQLDCVEWIMASARHRIWPLLQPLCKVSTFCTIYIKMNCPIL